jgi:hypothetical protein
VPTAVLTGPGRTATDKPSDSDLRRSSPSQVTIPSDLALGAGVSRRGLDQGLPRHRPANAAPWSRRDGELRTPSATGGQTAQPIHSEEEALAGPHHRSWGSHPAGRGVTGNGAYCGTFGVGCLSPLCLASEKGTMLGQANVGGSLEDPIDTGSATPSPPAAGEQIAKAPPTSAEGGQAAAAPDARNSAKPAASRHFRSWPRRKGEEAEPKRWKGKKAERRKLQSYIESVYQQARTFDQSSEKIGCAWSSERKLLHELIENKEKCTTDEDSMHDYADHLGQLLPLVANDAYLCTTLEYELEGGPTWESAKLSELLSREALLRLEISSSSLQKDPDDPNPESNRSRREIAEGLRILYRTRDDRRRHQRLVTKLRSYYLWGMGCVLFAFLALLGLAVFFVNSDAQLWEQLLLVGSAGALGSALAATLKLRDMVDELDAFRKLVAIVFIQPLIGMSLGLLSWLILTGKAITFNGLDTDAWETQAILAFASGFSEPFFLGTIGRVLGAR